MTPLAESIYSEFITRRRWKLSEGIWLVHGFLWQTKKGFGTKMEFFYSKDYSQKELDKDIEAGRLSEEFIDLMLSYDVKEETTVTRVIDIFKKKRVWEKLDSDWFMKPYDPETAKLIEPDHEAVWVEESVRKMWHMINTRADLKQCEVPYVDSNGTWYDLSPEALWNAAYLVNFARDAGIDVNWLVQDIAVRNNQMTIKSVTWSVKPSQRERDYGVPLTSTLQTMQHEGESEPNEKDVLNRWKKNPPQGIRNANDEGFEYKHRDGRWEHVKPESLRSAINRKIEKSS